MRSARTLGAALSFVAIASTSVAIVGCGSNTAPKTANIKGGPMPAGESWRGVYFHPVFGYLHITEEGSNVVGRWKRADESAWGELSGTKSGSVVHFKWKEHRYGMVGPAATQEGRGYFVYKAHKDSAAELKGEYGLGNDETGSSWDQVKQENMEPDLKSITGEGNPDDEGVGGDLE